VDRSTPRQTVLGLLRAVDDDEPAVAAQYLDLKGVRWGRQTPGEAAKQIADLIRLHMWLNPSAVSDVPKGDPSDGEDVERIGTVRVHGQDVPIMLTRVERRRESYWVFSQQTVSRAPDLLASLGVPEWMDEVVPDALESTRMWGLWGWQWIALVLALVVGYPIGFFVGTAITAMLIRLAQSTPSRWDNEAAAASRRPVRVVLGLFGFVILAHYLGLPGRVTDVLRTWVAVPIILVAGWAFLRATRAALDAVMADADEEDARTRGMRTHLLILRRIASATIVFFTIALALTRFAVVRDLGLSLLASAGVAGVALGFAAQKSLGAVIAGLQLSITQPVRLGDAIVWQGQWGTVEEITLTWLRLKLYDERRLVIPVDKFLVEPFENWSMPGDEMIGLIEIPVDPTVPVSKLRNKLEELAKDHPYHDGRECLLQLIELGATSALLRARVSTDEMMHTFSMRCDIREAMIAYLQELEGGRYLTRQRWQELPSSARAA
jgi:small-conductance mechanosensitive channel